MRSMTCRDVRGLGMNGSSDPDELGKKRCIVSRTTAGTSAALILSLALLTVEAEVADMVVGSSQ